MTVSAMAVLVVTGGGWAAPQDHNSSQTNARRDLPSPPARGLASYIAAAAPALAAPAPAARSATVESFDGADIMGGVVSADGLAAMMVDVLMADGRFSVIEKGSAGAAGARFLIKGSITRYDPIAGGAGVQVGGLPMVGRALGAGARHKVAKVAISLRLIDAASGQIVAVARAEGAASAQEADAGVLNGGDGSTMGANALRATSVGKALEDAMRKAAAELASKAPS